MKTASRGKRLPASGLAETFARSERLSPAQTGNGVKLVRERQQLATRATRERTRTRELVDRLNPDPPENITYNDRSIGRFHASVRAVASEFHANGLAFLID
jgi:hypothetical protein